MRVELSKNHENTGEIDKLIETSVGLFDNDTNFRLSGYNVGEMETNEVIINEFLLQNTNIENVFSAIKSSHFHRQSVFRRTTAHFLWSIRKSGKLPSFKTLLEVINEKINQLKSHPLNNYSLYIPCRIEYNLEKKEFSNLKKWLKKALGLEIKNPTQKVYKKISSEKFKSIYKTRRTVLKFDYSARDYYFAIDEFNNALQTFYGIICFANHQGMNHKSLINTSGDFAISQNPEDDYLIVLKDTEIEYPTKEVFTRFEVELKVEDISVSSKLIWNIHNRERGNFATIISILKCIVKTEKNMLPKAQEVFILYFEAITEKQIAFQFLKFWIIIERILKIGGKRTDESIKDITKKMLKKKHQKRLINRIVFLRNSLVHEYETKAITQKDRNITKTLCESLILLLIDPPTKLNNATEFRILLDGVFHNTENLKLQRRIINRIISLRQ